MGFCAFTEPILYTTGMSRNMFSTIYMCSTILGCCGILISGKLIDHFGIQRSLIITLPIWILTLFIFGLYTPIFDLIKKFVPISVFQIVFFTIIISFLRLLGQNVLPLLGRVQIVRTFSNKQGRAIASYGLLVSLCNGIVPSVMKWLSSNNDWERAFRILSLSSIIVFLVMLIFIKKEDAIASRYEISVQKKIEHNYLNFSSKKELLKMPIFWCIISTLCINAFIGTGTAVHIVDIFREKGVSENIALKSYIPLCMATIISGFIFGKLIDTAKIKFSILLMFLLQFLGLTGLMLAQYFFFIILYMISIGATWGGYGVLLTASWTRIFGQKHIGEILGIVYFLSAITGAMSVPLMSIFKNEFGTYSTLLNIIRLIVIMCAIFCLFKFPKTFVTEHN